MLERMFDPENGFWQLMSKLYKVCLLSLLWLVCCIPVVTAGAATTAFFDYTFALSENREGRLFRSYFKSFGAYFKRATPVFLCMLLAAVVLVVDLLFLLEGLLPKTLNTVLLAVACLASLVWVLVSLYLYSVLVKLRLSLRETLRRSLLMAVGHFPITVAMLAILGLFLFLSWKLPGLSVLLVGIAMFVNTYLLKYLYDRFPYKQGTDDEKDSESEE